MNIIKIVSFLLITFGLFLYFEITPKDLIEDIKKNINDIVGKKDLTLAEQIKKAKTKKKENYFESLVNETKEILVNNGTIGSFNKIIMASIISCIVGIVISLLINNLFIMPILALLFATFPFYFIKIQNVMYKNEIKGELETALSNITSSYMRYNTTFLDAVRENKDNIRYPLRASFEKFLFVSEHLNSNIKENLEELKKTINDDTFKEWVDGIIVSEEDYNLKATLTNIVNKFTDMRIINNELETKMYSPLRDYIYMVILTIASIPLFFIVNKEAVINYLNSYIGKIEITIVFIIIIITTAKVFKELKPTEYRS